MHPPFDRWRDAWSGARQGLLLGVAALVLITPQPGLLAHRTGVPTHALPTHALPLHSLPTLSASTPGPDFSGHAASVDVRLVAGWIAGAADNQQLPFALLDKRDARLFVFDGRGRIIGSSPVLLGAAVGDDSIAGIGNRAIASVRPEERTTPAGRFVSAPGKNATGEQVVWVDYDAAVSMHRVRPVDPKERRLERLASPDPAQRRISYGCINVPIAFFDSVVWPVLGAGRGIVYVLPEARDTRQVFAGLDRPTHAPRALASKATFRVGL